MEAMLSEFDYFAPTVIQSAIVAEYDDMISPVNALNTDAANPLNTIEFNIPGANDLYRDLNNSYLMIKIKLLDKDNANLAGTVAAGPVNLPLHSLFSTVSLTLCGREITEKDTLYPYRAYLETLLSHEQRVLETRFAAEGWAKDDPAHMDCITLAPENTKEDPNVGFVARRKLILASRACTLVGRPHLDLFHQPLDIPPNCAMSLKLVPGSKAFSLMEIATGSSKFVLLDAKLFVRTKKACPELVMAHKDMLQKTNMRFPYNRVTVTKHGIATGFKTAMIPLNFPSKLPKRVFIAFVKNSASSGTLAENPFNFEHFKLESITLSVNGVQVPAAGLQMDFPKKDCQRAYLNTLAALGMDNTNTSISLSVDEFLSGYAIYGFKIAPGPVDGTVFSIANSVGSVVVNVAFAEGLGANVDMIVYAETPAVLEIDKLSAVTLV